LHITQGHCYSTTSSADWWLDTDLWRRKVKPQDEPQKGEIKALINVMFYYMTKTFQGDEIP